MIFSNNFSFYRKLQKVRDSEEKCWISAAFPFYRKCHAPQKPKPPVGTDGMVAISTLGR
jgi:hypothetical protein